MNPTSPSGTDPLLMQLDAATIRQRSVGGAGVTAVAQALKFCLQMGSQLAMARLLDPAQFGLVAMVAPVLGLAMALADAGLGQAVVQRSALTQRQVSVLFWVNTGIGLMLSLLAAAAAPLVALLYGEPGTQAVTLASAGLILITTLSVLPLALLNRQLRFRALACIEVGCMAAGLLCGVLAAWWGAGLWALVLMQAVNAALTMVSAWAVCGWWPSRPAWPMRQRASMGAADVASTTDSTGGMLRFGAHMLGANLASYLSSAAAPVIIGVASGKVALGLYDRSYNLVSRPLQQLMAPTGRVAVPLLSRLVDTPPRYARAYLLMLQVTHAACLPGLVALVLGAGPLISFLLGPKWLVMVPVFAWIGAGGMAAMLSASTWWLFTSQARAREQMHFGIATAAISVVSMAVGALWGVVGVAAVSALSYALVQTPLLVWAATRRGPVTLGMLHKGLLPLLAAAALAAAACSGVLHALAGASVGIQTLAAFATAYGAFAASLLAQPAGRRLLAEARSMLAQRTPALC